MSNIVEKSKILRAGFTLNSDLDLRRREPMFPEKVAMCNEMLRTVGIPKVELLMHLKGLI
jgi:hypothetical protein